MGKVNETHALVGNAGEGNPARVALVIGAVQMIARLLVQFGVLDWLDEKAAESEGAWDDVAIKVVKGLITGIA